jgi:hypothetical protein
VLLDLLNFFNYKFYLKFFSAKIILLVFLGSKDVLNHVEVKCANQEKNLTRKREDVRKQ